MDTADKHTQNAHTKLRSARPSQGMVAMCACLGIMIFVGAVFSPMLTTGAGFIGNDDKQYVTGVGNIWSFTWHEAARTFQRFHHPSGTGYYYQPLTALSFMVDARLAVDWATAAFSFHLTNILLHVLNVALVFALVRLISGSTLWSILGALIFGLHPVQVESVAWISQRMTLLATFFTLLTLIFYMRYGATRRFRWLFLVTFFYLAAILSKPTFIAIPVVLLILDVWPLQRLTWRPIIEKTPLLILAATCGTVHYHLQAFTEPARITDIGGLGLLFRNAASLVTRTLWPVDLTPFNPVSHRAADTLFGAVADVAVVVLLLGVVLAAFRFSRPLFLAVAGAVVFVLPAMFNAPFADRLLGDQYLYAVLIVPLVAWAAWLKTRGNLLRHPWGRCVAVAAAAVGMIFAARSNIQTYIWQNNRSLYEHTVALYPHWASGYVGLVESAIQESDLDSALRFAKKAVDTDPKDPSTQFYLGRVLLLHRDGRSAEAVAPLRRALESDPDWIDCLHHLGIALADTGRLEEAIMHLGRARDLQPRSSSIRIDLGTAYLKANLPASARSEFQMALKERSGPMAHLGLAKAWADNDLPAYALRHLAVAVAQEPHCAVLAARYPSLRRLRSEPGFETLIDISGGDIGAGTLDWADRLPTRNSPGL